MFALFLGIKAFSGIVLLIVAVAVAAYAFRGKEQKLVDQAGQTLKTDVQNEAKKL